MNIAVSSAEFARLFGFPPRQIAENRPSDPVDFAAVDRLVPHPVYGALGWVAVVNPGEATEAEVIRLLEAAHAAAGRRFRRREQLS